MWIDLGVAELDEVAGREPRALELVDGDGVAEVAAGGVEQHERHVERGRGEQVEHARLRGDHDDRLGRLSDELIEGLAHRLVVTRGGRDGDPVAGVARRILDRVEDRLHAVGRRAGRDEHPDHVGFAGHQRPRGLVRAVAELVDDLLHALARLGPEVRRIVQDPRHRLVRDARDTRDITDVRRPRRARFRAHDGPDVFGEMCTFTFG